MITFHGFFKYFYERLFPKSKLAEKLKPWRTALILELTYGSWTLIRDFARKAFYLGRDPFYGILLDLLDNYLPLVLSMYSVTFRNNHFQEYFNAMSFIWVMFYCMNRRHYNKAPLVWIANVLYWKEKCPILYNTLRRFLSATDEYPVENAHSIIRAQTCDGDSAETLERKAKVVFQSKAPQFNFRSQFTPPKNYIFRHNQGKSLKVEGATILSNILSRIAADEVGNAMI